MVTTLPTNPVWRGSMNAISSYRGNSHHVHSPSATDRGDYNTAPQLSDQLLSAPTTQYGGADLKRVHSPNTWPFCFYSKTGFWPSYCQISTDLDKILHTVVQNTLVGRLRPRSVRGRLQAKPERLFFSVILVTHP